MRKRLEIIADLNRQVIDRPEVKDVMIPVQAYPHYYAVPMRMIYEFDNITSIERQRELCEKMITICPKLDINYNPKELLIVP